MKLFKPTQKFRLIIGDVSIYTTARQIRKGIGDFERSNTAAQLALCALEGMQSDNIPPIGLAGNWKGLQVQIDKAVF